MLNRCGLPVVLLLCLLAHAAAAYGASPSSSPGDPPAGSPSGAIYELPFEEGRADAAPKGSGGTSAEVVGGAGGGGGGDGESGSGGGSEGTGGDYSLYRSENNFGSSSQVPEDPSAGKSAGNDGAGGGGKSGAGAAGGGSGAPGRDATAAVEARRVASITDSGNTSPAANIALLLAIGLVAVGVGVVAARANRLRTQ